MHENEMDNIHRTNPAYSLRQLLLPTFLMSSWDQIISVRPSFFSFCATIVIMIFSPFKKCVSKKSSCCVRSIAVLPNWVNGSDFELVDARVWEGVKEWANAALSARQCLAIAQQHAQCIQLDYCITSLIIVSLPCIKPSSRDLNGRGSFISDGGLLIIPQYVLRDLEHSSMQRGIDLRWCRRARARGAQQTR